MKKVVPSEADLKVRETILHDFVLRRPIVLLVLFSGARAVAAGDFPFRVANPVADRNHSGCPAPSLPISRAPFRHGMSASSPPGTVPATVTRDDDTNASSAVSNPP